MPTRTMKHRTRITPDRHPASTRCGMVLKLLQILLMTLLAGAVRAGEPPVAVFKIGVLPFGTLNWELHALQSEALDKQHQVRIETVPVATAEAGKVALLGGRVDLIVSDWFWVASQRLQNRNMQFYPYSTTQGALLVPADSPIRQPGDLAGRKLGVAGGGLDKNWLLLRAFVRKTTGQELERITTPVFGAPPLLNQQLSQGRLDAVLNYWNFAAKLEASGYKTLLDGTTLLQELGFPATLPSLGYVFSESFAASQAQNLNRLFDALQQARNLICERDESWSQVVQLTEEQDPAVQHRLRTRYCGGRIQHFDQTEQKAAADLYALLHPATPRLPPGVFWQGRR
jgi:NitT/TauT family transport system substrate-binding protein